MPPQQRRTSFPGLQEMLDRRRELMDELAATRRERGLSQTEIAARMGTSQSAVARLERGGLDARLSTLERYRGGARSHRRLAGPTARGVTMSVWPTPHEPHRTPWQPDPHPPSPPPSAPSQWHLVDSRQDWLDERLLDQRVVSLAGSLDAEAANRAAASLALLDASGDDPVELRLCDVDADLDIALTLVDTLDLMGVPVHATCLGEVSGPAIAILAVADHRTAARHATLHLREPRTRWSGHAATSLPTPSTTNAGCGSCRSVSPGRAAARRRGGCRHAGRPHPDRGGSTRLRAGRRRRCRLEPVVPLNVPGVPAVG
jgi:Protease subunit of ATP-dependent Clp proteases